MSKLYKEKFLNLVSKLEEKNTITTFMLSAEQFFESKRKEVEQGSEKQGVQAVDVTMDRSNDQSKEFVPER
ncbi:hypothetical protein RDI58_008592 [Solanum bulbocastanum]|uniref:Uncharacterized protein n=1 Tax=Solanum bulbocastanum TaxID=147425 RepID=A0AAN8TYM1_SOLBU